jgi:hypothetical protein
VNLKWTSDIDELAMDKPLLIDYLTIYIIGIP